MCARQRSGRWARSATVRRWRRWSDSWPTPTPRCGRWRPGRSAHANPDRAPAALVGALSDRERDVRASVAWALYTIGDPGAAGALDAALRRETDAEVQHGLIRALGATGEASVAALERLVTSPDPEIRVSRSRPWPGATHPAPGPGPGRSPDPLPEPVALESTRRPVTSGLTRRPSLGRAVLKFQHNNPGVHSDATPHQPCPCRARDRLRGAAANGSGPDTTSSRPLPGRPGAPGCGPRRAGGVVRARR